MSQLIYEKFLRTNGVKFNSTPIGLHFNYQGGNFLIFNNANDELYLQLLMPNIYDVTENEQNKVLKHLNELNSNIKAVKGCIRNNAV